MGQALYRKYRSKKLSEIVGQEHITTALDNALKSGKISHAYLFTGPRGVGKTSIARILAHEINGLPYDETATHLDIIEIDAASNRRIDEIRELRERVNNAPAQAKYKVYIIDEVHMLTREAFNALLKTLEEPPAHAIFILATTEAHKLPETIISRTQRYTFRPIDQREAVEHLKSIAKKEKIAISNEALQLIAEHGDGSFRDAISLLDQVRNIEDQITLQTVQQSLGIAPEEAIGQLIQAIESGSAQHILDRLSGMRTQGYNAALTAKQLAEFLRRQLLERTITLPSATITRLLRELLAIPASPDGARLLEIILLETALENSSVPEPAQQTAESAPARKPTSPPEAAVPADEKPKAKPSPKSKEETTPEPAKETAAKEPSSPVQAGPLDNEKWQQVLQAIKSRHNTLYSVARMAVPSFDGAELTLAFSFPFHQKRLNDAKNKKIISDIIHTTTGQNVTITCIVDIEARAKPAAITAPVEANPSVKAISNIFGGGEVLE